MTEKNVLWIHNFPKKPGGGGSWMFNQYDFFKTEADIYFLSGLRNPINFFLHLIRLYRVSKKYEIVHAQYGSAVGFITSFLPAKRVLSLKGSDWYTSPSKSFFHKVRVSLGGLLSKWAIPKFDFIIVMSDAMKDEVSKKYPKIKIQTVVDPIDLNYFREDPKRTTSKTGKSVLFAASDLDNPIKRVWLAEKAFDILRKEMPEVKLVKMTNVPRQEVCEFMLRMDAILLTSVYEGWPNVIKEMLALNKPFVSTDVSDLKQFAERTKSCFICDPNPEQLAMALKKTLSAPKEDLRKLVEGFSMERTIERINSIYQEVTQA